MTFISSFPLIQTVDSTPLPVHTPTFKEKGCPGSTGFPPKVFNLVISMVCSKTKREREWISSAFVFTMIFTTGFLKITNIKAEKENKFYMNGNNHH